MNAKLLRLCFAALVLVGLNGCASLSKSECMSADWEDIGVRDGANGRPEEYLLQHSKACAKVNVVPDHGAWNHGRERGLERFCVPQRVYQIGEYGGGVDLGVCRNYDVDRLASAYGKGREVNRLSNAINSINAEIGDVHDALDQKDLEPKERERLAYRLGRLVYERRDAQDAYQEARWRAQDL